MINTVIRSPDNMVLVFDENGEQMPAYQGKYEEVRKKIMREALAGTVFQKMVKNQTLRVSRDEW
jgi:hypothetical protein